MGQEQVKRWIHLADDWTDEERMEMLKFWLNNPILLGFGDEHQWDTHLDKEVYVR